MFPAATPHGPLTDVCEGVRLVRGTFRMGPGLVISRTMTVIELDDGVCVVNSVRLTPEGEAELTRRGPVRHVIKLADGHGLDDPYYLRDGATFWSTADAKHPSIPRGRTFAPDSPVPGARAIQLPGTSEAVLWLPHGGGTLVTCDAVQNHVDLEGASLFARWMTPILGFSGSPLVAPPIWRRRKSLDPEGVRRALAPIADLAYANLVTGHGPAMIGGASERVRAALAAL